MIDLEGKTIIIRTDEEHDRIIEEGKKQGFTWRNSDDLYKILTLPLPFELVFKYGSVTWSSHNDCRDVVENTYEASSIIEEDKENVQLSAVEFIDFMKQFINCADKYECYTCVLDRKNTKCRKSLCLLCSWPGNEKELIEIAKRGKTTVKEKNKYEEAIDVLNAYSDAALHVPCETDFYKALELAIEALKEVNKKEL